MNNDPQAAIEAVGSSIHELRISADEMKMGEMYAEPSPAPNSPASVESSEVSEQSESSSDGYTSPYEVNEWSGQMEESMSANDMDKVIYVS
jgi:hypothetical protein